MISTIFGLPAHPLVVHAVVVLVPLAALSGLTVALWPAARARYAPLALAVATLALISVPLATSTGENLESHVRQSAFVHRHTSMADGLLPFVALLWLAMAALVAARVLRERNWAGYLAAAAVVVAAAGAVGSGVQVVRIGDSGARAAWHGVAGSPGRAPGPHH